MPWSLQLPGKSYAGYIFDCDGTIADSMPLHYQSWLHAVRIQIPAFEWPEKLFYSMAGLNVTESVSRLNAHFGVQIDARKAEQDKLSFFETVSHLIEPIPPVVALASELAAKNIPRAIGTGAHRTDAEQTLKAVGARSLFEIVVAQEDVKRGKPDPETFLRAAELMGVEPSQCLVLEDGELGIQAATSANMDIVRIPHNWRDL